MPEEDVGGLAVVAVNDLFIVFFLYWIFFALLDIVHGVGHSVRPLGVGLWCHFIDLGWWECGG